MFENGNQRRCGSVNFMIDTVVDIGVEIDAVVDLGIFLSTPLWCLRIVVNVVVDV
jgi:hypothetical protein